VIFIVAATCSEILGQVHLARPRSSVKVTGQGQGHNSEMQLTIIWGRAEYIYVYSYTGGLEAHSEK